MRLLVVMANYPFPPRTGSSIVAYHSMKHLSKKHRIELVCLNSSLSIPEPAEFVARAELLPQRKYSKPIRWVRYLFYLLMGEPPLVSSSASRSMNEKVKSKVESGQFDAILLFEMTAIQYCPASSFDRLIVNIEDPPSIKLRRMAELPIWSVWQKVKYFVLIKSTVLYEQRIFHRIGKILLLSKADIRDANASASYTNLAHMPYGVDEVDEKDVSSYEDRDRVIVFSGNMFHPPNVDGALSFLKEVFPMVLQGYPNAKLLIVGADPDDRIYAAAEKFGKHVVITGRVNDVAGYVKRATVSICPVRLKIGAQTKILEALSWGTPVVTTSAGNSGINGVSGTHLWVEDDPHSLAKRICDLLQGRDWSRLSSEGRKLVAERFSWEGSVKQLERHLDRTVVKA